MKGDAPFETVNFQKIASVSKRWCEIEANLVKKNFITVKNEAIDLYVAKDHPFYRLGKFYKETETEIRFAVIFELTFRLNSNFQSKQKQLAGKDVIVIETVHTSKDYRNSGIAQKFYETILSKFVIISDQLQYEGAVNLWKRLIANNNVFIYDILEDKIISKVTSNTPETHIWSDDSSKRRIRLIMIP